MAITLVAELLGVQFSTLRGPIFGFGWCGGTSVHLLVTSRLLPLEQDSEPTLQVFQRLYQTVEETLNERRGGTPVGWRRLISDEHNDSKKEPTKATHEFGSTGWKACRERLTCLACGAATVIEHENRGHDDRRRQLKFSQHFVQ